MTQIKTHSTSTQTEVSLKHRTTIRDGVVWAIHVVQNKRHDIWERAARVLRNGEPWGEVRKNHNGTRVTMSPYGKIIPVAILKEAEKDLG